MKISQQLIISNEILEEETFCLNKRQALYAPFVEEKFTINLFHVLQCGSNPLFRNALAENAYHNDSLRYNSDCFEAIASGYRNLGRKEREFSPCKSYSEVWNSRSYWIKEVRASGSYGSAYMFGMALNSYLPSRFKCYKMAMEKAIRIAQFLDT